MNTDILPSIATREIAGDLMPTVNARDLHTALQVGRDFSNWIKDRLTKYRFVEGTDFVIVSDLSSPNLASSKSRAQRIVEYHAIRERMNREKQKEASR